MSACPYCNSVGRIYVEAFSDALDKCSSCGLIYLEPPPSQAQMVARHASQEYAEHPYFSKGEEITKGDVLPVHKIALELLSRHLSEGERVIDIGAGTGDFLELAAKRYKVSAVEPSPFLAEKIRNRIGCLVFVGAFEDYGQPASADAVILMDIIEHTADPRALLAEVRKTLRPNGVLFISTVDSASLLYRLGPVIWRLSRWSKFADYLLHRIFCKQHNWYFNRTVLSKLVAEAGFKVLEHKGFEFPLDRLTESQVVLLGLRVLYLVQSLLGTNTEQYLVAQNG
jgi:2-polyprenyl-3-methyl-5-hydroxy-6-metoxy-1,4-benzoquinol methylase